MGRAEGYGAIKAPQETAAHTARNEVKGAGLARRHEIASGGSHVLMMGEILRDWDQISLSLGSQQF